MDWTKIKADYIAGGTSYRKLCDKYGVSRTTLQRKALEEGWVELRRQAEAKSETRIVNGIIKQKGEYGRDIIAVADKLLGRMSDLIDEMPKLSPMSMRNLTAALRDLKDIKGIRSEIDLREQEARIRSLERQAEADNEDNEIKVIIEGDLGKYSQ